MPGQNPLRRLSRQPEPCRLVMTISEMPRQSSTFAVANCLAVLCFNLSLRQGDPAGGNERGDGLFYRLKAGKSGAVSKTLPAFLNGDAGATHNVSPRRFCIALL